MSTVVDRCADRIVGLPRPLLLAFDVDGTLAPIVARPERARVPTATRRVLAHLAASRGIDVALVTGRDAASLRRVVRVARVWRALEHGRLVVAPGERLPAERLSSPERDRLQAFERWFSTQARPHGARLERKPSSRAVHVRELALRDTALAQRILAQAAAQARRLGLSLRDGRAVVEVALARADKAEALAAIARRCRARGVCYVGDDRTDYRAIRQTAELGGVGVFVRSAERRRAPRGASVTLAGPDQVAQLLRQLGQILPRAGRPRNTR